MYCKSCGEKLPEDARFCKRCGQRMKSRDESFAAVPPPPVPPLLQEPPWTAAPVQQAGRSARKGVLGWWISGGALTIAAAVLVGIFAGPLLKGVIPAMERKETAAASAGAEDFSTVAPSIESTPEPTETPPAVVDPASLEYATITWYMLGQQDMADLGIVQDRVNETLKQKINAGLDLKFVDWSGDYENKMDILFASGEPADLCFTSNWYLNFNSHCASGTFLPLDALLDRYGGDITEALGWNYLKGASVGGKVYGLPMNAAKCHYYGLLLKKDLVDKYGVDVSSVRSVQDLEPVFDKILANEPNIVPLYTDAYYSPARLLDWNVLSGSNAPGALYSSNDPANTRIVNQYTAPESVAMYTMMREYRLKGYTNPAALTNENRSSGKCFAVIEQLSPGMDYERTKSSLIEWVQVPLTAPVTATADATIMLQAIPATSRNPERTMMFCDLLYSDAPLVNTLYYGIEGTHYTRLNGDVIQYDGTSNNYMPYFSWTAGNPQIALLPDGQYPAKWREWDALNRNAVFLDSLGFAFDPSAVTDEIKACQTVYEKYYIDLVTGVGDQDVDTMISGFEAELAAAGADKIIYEMQKQYDAWRAAGR